MLININQFLSKLFLIFVVFGLANSLHAECTENEIKTLFTQEVMEMKKNGFFDFKNLQVPSNQNNEIRYYFMAKKHSLEGDKVYGGLLVADTRVCEVLKETNLEKLKPLFVSDFKKEGKNTGEGCSLDKVKNIIYNELLPELENGFHSYSGSIMKSWGYYEFVYTTINTNPDQTYSVNYLGRIEITKSKCSIKEHLMVAIY